MPTTPLPIDRSGKMKRHENPQQQTKAHSRDARKNQNRSRSTTTVAESGSANPPPARTNSESSHAMVRSDPQGSFPAQQTATRASDSPAYHDPGSTPSSRRPLLDQGSRTYMVGGHDLSAYVHSGNAAARSERHLLDRYLDEGWQDALKRERLRSEAELERFGAGTSDSIREMSPAEYFDFADGQVTGSPHHYVASSDEDQDWTWSGGRAGMLDEEQGCDQNRGTWPMFGVFMVGRERLSGSEGF